MKRMKICALISVLFVLLTQAVRANEGQAATDQPTVYEETARVYSADDFGADAIFDALPDEVREYLPDGAEQFDANQTVENYSFGFFAGVIGKMLTTAIKPAVAMFSTLLGLIVISSALGALKGLFKSDTLTAVFDFVSGLCIMLAMFTTVSGLFGTARTYLNQLSTLMNTLLPVMTAMNIAGGNLTASVVSSNAMMIALTFIETLAAKVLFPILQVCFGMTVASCMGGSLKLDGITKLVRGTFTWLLGLIAAGISALMSFQTSIAASADSLSMRAVRFAATSAIPVAGGIAADAVRTVGGSLSLVKSTVGWVGIVIILLITLPVIANILLTRLGVVVTETAADVIGLDREKRLLAEMSGLLGFLAAICVIASLMLVYALALFARSAAAIGT